MKSCVYTASLEGINAQLIKVEVNLLHRLPGITIVGLPGNAVRESSERVRCAILSSGFEFPRYRITVNLAPASLKKEGSGLDLPIALAILQASGQLKRNIDGAIVAGELSLHGELHTVPGLLNCAALLEQDEFHYMICADTGCETLQFTSLPALTASTLAELVDRLELGLEAAPSLCHEHAPLEMTEGLSIDVKGQGLATKAMELAAAGGHHVCMMGPPGVGKTLIANSFKQLLPSLNKSQALEVNRIYSAVGLLTESQPWIHQAPFRSPHTSISTAGLTGGQSLKPGEATLAHHGVLFLDEFLEFRPSVLDCLRSPLEEGYIHISRSQGSVRLPANFILLAASNPCPCGYLYHPEIPCRCLPQRARLYQSRCSGPLMERLSLRIPMENHPQWSETSWSPLGVRQLVKNARSLQEQRNPSAHLNAKIKNWDELELPNFPTQLRQYLLELAALERWSSRELNQRLGVARTAADLRGSANIQEEDLELSLSLRFLQEPSQC